MTKRQKASKTLALALAVTVALAPVASASNALGHELSEANTLLSTGTELTQGLLWSDSYSDRRYEQYFTYTPNSQVQPTLAYGDNVCSRYALTTMAKTLEAQGKRVVSGINGDYFNMDTGNPTGLVVTGGIIRCASPYNYAVGFLSDGSAFIGTPGVGISASFLGEYTAIYGGLNKVRTADNYYLYNSDFYANTRNTEAGVDVILRVVTDNVGETALGNYGVNYTVSDQPKLFGRVECVVEQVIETSSATALSSGRMVLSINAKGDAAKIEKLKQLSVGNTVTFDFNANDARFGQVTQAIGAMYKLVTNGTVETTALKAISDQNTRARSAIGIKADGTMILYTIDGNQSGYSIGATLTQVAMRLVELGCVEAVCMDGGGSTTAGATYPDGSSMQLISKPSDGSQRAVSTAIFMTTTQTATGTLAHLQVSPSGSMVLAGSSLWLSATGLDTNYYPTALTDQPVYEIQSGGGSVTTGGYFTAGTDSGKTWVTASLGGATGATCLTVHNTVDSISVVNESTGAALTSLNARQGWQVDLTAVAKYKSCTLSSTDTAFQWSVSGSVGVIDENGTFTANGTGGTGTITVSAGGTSVSIPVTVMGEVKTVETFEDGTDSLTGTDTVTVTPETATTYVRYGTLSAALTYDTGTGGSARVMADLALESGEAYLALWVYGDQSGNSLTATMTNASGTESNVALTSLDFTGWKRITAAIPSGMTKISSLQVLYAGGGKTTGTIWLDQITAGNTTAQDETAPTVQVTLSGTQLTATVKDNIDTSIPRENVALTRDGVAMNFTWDEASGTLSATVPSADSQTHRFSVTASDASGNLARGSADMAAQSEKTQIFRDVTSAHWAKTYAEYLYDTEVTTGVPQSSGLYFYPDNNITRAEFFTLLARWLELDTAMYENVILPFSDAASIPDWALDEVKAMYAIGVLQGVQSGDKLLCNAQANISRAEAMTMLGRIQPKGYEEASLSSFTDAAQVPSWAESHVRSLVGQGVVSGSGNKLNPNQPISRGETAKILFAMR